MVRTIAEIRQGRVTIQETEGSTVITVALNDSAKSIDPSERLYTAAEVMAENYARSKADRDNLVTELDKALGRLNQAERDRDTFKAQAYEQNERAVRLARQVVELGKTLEESRERADRETERADANRDWAERAEARVTTLEQSVAARDHLLAEATQTIERVRKAVWVSHLDHAMEHRGNRHVVENYLDDLASAVSSVRSVTGQPSA